MYIIESKQASSIADLWTSARLINIITRVQIHPLLLIWQKLGHGAPKHFLLRFVLLLVCDAAPNHHHILLVHIYVVHRVSLVWLYREVHWVVTFVVLVVRLLLCLPLVNHAIIQTGVLPIEEILLRHSPLHLVIGCCSRRITCWVQRWAVARIEFPCHATTWRVKLYIEIVLRYIQKCCVHLLWLVVSASPLHLYIVPVEIQPCLAKLACHYFLLQNFFRWNLPLLLTDIVLVHVLEPTHREGLVFWVFRWGGLILILLPWRLLWILKIRFYKCLFLTLWLGSLHNLWIGWHDWRCLQAWTFDWWQILLAIIGSFSLTSLGFDPLFIFTQIIQIVLRAFLRLTLCCWTALIHHCVRFASLVQSDRDVSVLGIMRLRLLRYYNVIVALKLLGNEFLGWRLRIVLCWIEVDIVHPVVLRCRLGRIGHWSTITTRWSLLRLFLLD